MIITPSGERFCESDDTCECGHEQVEDTGTIVAGTWRKENDRYKLWGLGKMRKCSEGYRFVGNCSIRITALPGQRRCRTWAAPGQC